MSDNVFHSLQRVKGGISSWQLDIVSSVIFLPTTIQDLIIFNTINYLLSTDNINHEEELLRLFTRKL